MRTIEEVKELLRIYSEQVNARQKEIEQLTVEGFKLQGELRLLEELQELNEGDGVEPNAGKYFSSKNKTPNAPTKKNTKPATTA